MSLVILGQDLSAWLRGSPSAGCNARLGEAVSSRGLVTLSVKGLVGDILGLEGQEAKSRVLYRYFNSKRENKPGQTVY